MMKSRTAKTFGAILPARRSMVAAIAAAALAVACGGGGAGDAGPRTIAAGQTITLSAGEAVLVPQGTTVFDPVSSSTVTIMGDHNTIHTHAGAQVSAPGNATGPADNTVTTL